MIRLHWNPFDSHLFLTEANSCSVRRNGGACQICNTEPHPSWTQEQGRPVAMPFRSDSVSLVWRIHLLPFVKIASQSQPDMWFQFGLEHLHSQVCKTFWLIFELWKKKINLVKKTWVCVCFCVCSFRSAVCIAHHQTNKGEVPISWKMRSAIAGAWGWEGERGCGDHRPAGAGVRGQIRWCLAPGLGLRKYRMWHPQREKVTAFSCEGCIYPRLRKHWRGLLSLFLTLYLSFAHLFLSSISLSFFPTYFFDEPYLSISHHLLHTHSISLRDVRHRITPWAQATLE